MERSAALALYEKAVGAMPGVERKGDTMPYTSLNGHMFSVLHKDGSVALRLPTVEREASFAYVGSLKPKPATTKKGSSPKKKPG